MRTSAILATLLASVFILSLPAVALTPHTSTADLTVESGTADWDAFSWEWASQTERMAITLPEPITAGNVLIRMYRDVYGDIALEAGPFSVDGTGTNATLEITSTNIPTWALYYADIMQIDESATPDQYKSLGRGTIKRAWSAWDTTNFVGTTTSVQLVYSYGTNDTILWNQTYDWVHAYSNLTPTYAWVQSYVATNAGAALQLTAGSTQPLSGELYLGSPTAPQDSTSIIRFYLGASSTNYLLAGFGRVDDHYRQRLRWLNPGVVAEMDVNYYPLANYIDYLDSDLRTTHVATNNDSLVNFLCLNTALGGYVATSNATYTNTVALAATAAQLVGGNVFGQGTETNEFKTNVKFTSGDGSSTSYLFDRSTDNHTFGSRVALSIDATSGTDAMNFQTTTGLIAEAVAPLVATNNATYTNTVALAATAAQLSSNNVFTGGTNSMPFIRLGSTYLDGSLGVWSSDYTTSPSGDYFDLISGTYRDQRYPANSVSFKNQTLYSPSGSEVWQSEGTATTGNDIVNYQTATGLIAAALAPYYLASNPSNFTSAAAVNAITNNGFTINGVPVANGSNVTVAASGGSPSAIFIPWYENDFNDSDQPNLAQIGSPLIYAAWQDYTNVATRLNAKIGASVSGDVWTITHHAGPQTGTNVTFDVLYAITKGQATPSAWTFTNAVTATWNATNMYDNVITHTLTNTIAGTNSVRLWISKVNSAIGSGYWYWGDTTIEVER